MRSSTSLPVRALFERLDHAALAEPDPFPEDVARWAAFLPEHVRNCHVRSVVGRFHRGATAGSDEECPQAAAQVAGRVWSLSQQAEGCREVQRAIDGAASDEERVAIAREMWSHVLDAARCPHANHVVQKVIATLPNEELSFVVDEVLEGSNHMQVACHKYGCRIVQRLIERRSSGQAEVRRLVDVLLEGALALSLHTYGNYVVQRLLEHAEPAQRLQLVETIRHNLADMCRSPHGCTVLLAAIRCEQGLGQGLLARDIVREEGLAEVIKKTRHGPAVLKAAHAAACGKADAAA